MSDLDSLFDDILRRAEKKAERPKRVRPPTSRKQVSTSRITEEKVRAIVKEEIDKLRDNLLRELHQLVENNRTEIDIDGVVNTVVERALEQLPSIIFATSRKKTPTSRIIVTEEDIEAIMPYLREFSYSKKKKRHWGPRRFVPIEFYEYLRSKGVNIALDKLRAILRELLRRGVLRKTSEARYQLVEKKE